MRQLHTIHPPIDQPLAWYGVGLRCGDSYHEGYTHEREDTQSHGDCCRRVFRDLNIAFIATWHCDCACQDEQPRNHFFPQRQGDRYEDPATHGIMCLHCQAGNHPIAPEGRT